MSAERFQQREFWMARGQCRQLFDRTDWTDCREIFPGSSPDSCGYFVLLHYRCLSSRCPHCGIAAKPWQKGGRRRRLAIAFLFVSTGSPLPCAEAGDNRENGANPLRGRRCDRLSLRTPLLHKGATALRRGKAVRSRRGSGFSTRWTRAVSQKTCLSGT